MNVTINFSTCEGPESFALARDFVEACRQEALAREARSMPPNAEPIVQPIPLSERINVSPAYIGTDNIAGVVPKEQKAENATAAGEALAAGLQAGIKASDAPTVAAAKTGAEKAFEKAVTKSELRSAALKVSKAGKSEELAKLFKSFGANKLSEIAEADYAAVLEGLVKLNA